MMNEIQDIIKTLKQGDKIEFMWHGNSTLVYIGRIETRGDEPYFVGEHNYQNDEIRSECEGMRYYNRLMSFYDFTYLKKLN